MALRIYVDESGTHESAWLIIGMLFVPDHGVLHAELCKVKDSIGYLNKSPKHSAKYKETHLAGFRSPRDLQVAKLWIDLFVQHSCYFRCIVIDWSIWDGSYFGDAFDPEALKKRRAYKKWAEMLLRPEFRPSGGNPQIFNARLYLDRLLILHGYDVIDHLRDRFTRNYEGSSPYIETFQHTDSSKDANQCLQMCDLLVGCLYQQLVPSQSPEKLGARDYLAQQLMRFGVKRMDAGFWKGFDPETLTQHFPKYSARFWRPSK